MISRKHPSCDVLLFRRNPACRRNFRNFNVICYRDPNCAHAVFSWVLLSKRGGEKVVGLRSCARPAQSTKPLNPGNTKQIRTQYRNPPPRPGPPPKKGKRSFLHAHYDWTTGVPDNGNERRKVRAVPRLCLAFPCFVLC